MGKVYRGVNKLLEEEANRLIKESLAGVTKHSEKSDILTPWKEIARYKREVYVSEGVPDKAFRQGMFHRAANSRRPDLNSREGLASATRARTQSRTATARSSLADHVEADKYSFDD